ncbi:MAG: cytidine deaminase, partial [Pyrinomonadaceae bacterium]
MKHSDKELIEAATKVRENAYAPYSEFRVGSALETDDGHIIVGSNVESASYGLTVCAERVAVWNAISQGKRKIVKIAVVADTEALTPPCGVCRQIIW